MVGLEIVLWGSCGCTWGVGYLVVPGPSDFLFGPLPVSASVVSSSAFWSLLSSPRFRCSSSAYWRQVRLICLRLHATESPGLSAYLTFTRLSLPLPLVCNPPFQCGRKHSSMWMHIFWSWYRRREGTIPMMGALGDLVAYVKESTIFLWSPPLWLFPSLRSPARVSL